MQAIVNAILNSIRDRLGRLIQIWVDGGYRGKDFSHWVIDVYRWVWSVVTRHQEQKGFVVLPKRLWKGLLAGSTGVEG